MSCNKRRVCFYNVIQYDISHVTKLTSFPSFSRIILLQIVKKVELEAQRAKGPSEAKGGRRRRNPVEDLKREVAIMRTLRHKNIVSLQVSLLITV